MAFANLGNIIGFEVRIRCFYPPSRSSSNKRIPPAQLIPNSFFATSTGNNALLTHAYASPVTPLLICANVDKQYARVSVTMISRLILNLRGLQDQSLRITNTTTTGQLTSWISPYISWASGIVDTLGSVAESDDSDSEVSTPAAKTSLSVHSGRVARPAVMHSFLPDM